ncbi:MAG: hypothetical protein WBH14_02370, partial [Albidovulum sp.]
MTRIQGEPSPNRQQAADSHFPPISGAPLNYVLAQIGERCSGPGGLYNAGNIIALCSGLAAQVINSAGAASMTELVQQYFFGNPAASCLTLSMIVFIASG